MPPAAGSQLPAQVDPNLMRILAQRARMGVQGQVAGPMPNSMNNPVVPGNMPGAPPQANIPRPGATPAQNMMKTATTAQSPMLDDGTRMAAKGLIMQLMKHM